VLRNGTRAESGIYFAERGNRKAPGLHEIAQTQGPERLVCFLTVRLPALRSSWKEGLRNLWQSGLNVVWVDGFGLGDGGGHEGVMSEGIDFTWQRLGRLKKGFFRGRLEDGEVGTPLAHVVGEVGTKLGPKKS